MNWLMKQPEVSQAQRIPELTLEELLTELTKYGRPRVGMFDGTWNCTVEMNTNTIGADFKCASDFKHTSPISAARQCLERVYKAIEAYRT